MAIGSWLGINTRPWVTLNNGARDMTCCLPLRVGRRGSRGIANQNSICGQ